MAALQRLSLCSTVREYPVWFWCHWPAVSLGKGSPRRFLSSLRNGCGSMYRLMRDFHSRVDVGDVLQIKRQALFLHKSQMTKFRPDSRWHTLVDIANGQWVECFFQDFELFQSYQMAGDGA